MESYSYKIGDLVKCISNSVENESCTNKIGKIIHMDKDYPQPYVVQFFKYINGHDGHAGSSRKGKDGYCWCFQKEHIKLYGEPILKLFLKEKENESSIESRKYN